MPVQVWQSCVDGVADSTELADTETRQKAVEKCAGVVSMLQSRCGALWLVGDSCRRIARSRAAINGQLPPQCQQAPIVISLRVSVLCKLVTQAYRRIAKCSFSTQIVYVNNSSSVLQTGPLFECLANHPEYYGQQLNSMAERSKGEKQQAAAGGAAEPGNSKSSSRAASSSDSKHSHSSGTSAANTVAEVQGQQQAPASKLGTAVA